MERRNFVKKLAAAGAAITSLPEIAQALDERVRALRDDVLQTADDAALWRRVRKEFALNPGLVDPRVKYN